MKLKLFFVLFITSQFLLLNTIFGKKSDKMVNLGVGFLLTSSEFQPAFSKQLENDKEYYRLPFNTWNDYTYFTYSADWKLKGRLRYGWGMEFCLGGSGGDGKDSIKVDKDTDLGKAYGGTFYAIYNSYHIPLFFNLMFSTLQISKNVEIFIGGSTGGIFGIFTYNELIEKNRSSVEENAEKTFFTVNFMYQIYGLIKVKISDSFETMYLMINYRFAKNPILTNDFLNSGNTTRRIQFQSDGLIIGFGFRY